VSVRPGCHFLYDTRGGLDDGAADFLASPRPARTSIAL